MKFFSSQSKSSEQKTQDSDVAEPEIEMLSETQAKLGNNTDTFTKTESHVEPAPATVPVKKTRDKSLYKALLSGLYDGVLIFDSHGHLIEYNKRAELFFGYDENEFWDMHCNALIAAVSDKVLNQIRAHVSSGRFTVVNAACTRKDGTTFPAEIAISSINFINDGDLVFSVRNLERKEKARQKRELGVEALQYAQSGIIVCTFEGMIEFVNPSFVNILGFKEEKDVLQHFIGDFCTSHKSAVALIKIPSTHGTWLGKLELSTALGSIRHVLATSSLTHKKRGSDARIIMTMTPLPEAIV
ncbi:MAG: PAS domain-containing protein [Lentisphaerae bacterium]|nr:PAS domain-containing protein [Lentisphaerota bacterium]